MISILYRLSKRINVTFLAFFLYSGCSQHAELAHLDAPIIYDFNQRTKFARITSPWTRLLPAGNYPASYLGEEWGEIRSTVDGSVYRWIKEKKATFYFDCYSPADIKLSIRAFPYARSYLNQSMKVYVNGSFCGKKVLKEGRNNFQNYQFSVPAKDLVLGQNRVELRFRYSSTRRKRSAAIHEVLIAGLQETPTRLKPHDLPTPKGWKLTGGQRISWRIVVPRHGYLRYQFVQNDNAKEKLSAHIFLRIGSQRVQLNSLTDSQEKPETISLARHGGERAELEFELHGDSNSSVLWPICEVGGEIQPKDVNIHIHTLDTLRPDRLGMFGYDKPTSPNLDRLASQGSLFKKAFTCSNASISSHMSMFTGRYPQSHGIVHNGLEVNKQQVTLAELLNRKGFLSTCYTHWQFLSWGTTTGKGFTTRNPVPEIPQKVEMGPTIRNVYAKAAMWVEKNWREKQLLWTHSQFMHMKGVPEPYRSMLFDSTPAQPGDEPLRHIYKDIEDSQAKFLYQKSAIEAGEIQPDSQASLDAIYDGAILMSDEFIGAFMNAVDHLGLLPFTAIIILSDHGLSLGERFEVSHLGPPYEHLMHIPMIMIFPGLDVPMQPEIQGLVETVDILPTLLSYLNIDIPRRIQGADLMPLVRGQTEKVKDYVFSCLGRSKGRRWYSIRDPDWLYYSEFDNSSALMNVVDPLKTGMDSVEHLYPEHVERLKKPLMEWIAQTPVVSDRTSGELSEEVKDLLIKAGYLGKDGTKGTQ